MGALFSLFSKKEERRPASLGGGIANALKSSYSGIISVILSIIVLAVFTDFSRKDKVVTGIWLFVFIFLLFTPVPVGASGLICPFAMPMFGILSSVACCQCTINENIALFFVGGWLLLLLNNCGLDKRMACAFLTAGDKDSYTPKKLLLKSCMAAFFASALGERELSTQAVMGSVISALQPLQKVKNEANYAEIKNIVCNALAISSAIGSLCIVHSSIITLQMRSLFGQAGKDSEEFPDVFNYLNYSVFAVPTAILMFILNTLFQTYLLSRYEGKPITARSKEILQKEFKKQQTALGPMSSHEKVSSFFMIVILLCYFTRWSKWLNMGWATFRRDSKSPELCGIKDATTASIFAILLHFLPKSLNFLKVFTANKRRDLPEMKMESGILFWKFIDKRTDYSLLYIIGSGTILYKSMITTSLHEGIRNFVGASITGIDWNGGIFIVVLVSVFLGSIMSGIASQTVLMPFVLGMAMSGDAPWPQRQYLCALAVGIGSGLGFCLPYDHSPCTYVRTMAKVPPKKQAMYSFVSIIICMIILWLMLCFYAPILWDPNDNGIVAEVRIGAAGGASASSESAGAGGGGGGGGDGGGGAAATPAPEAEGGGEAGEG